MARNHNLKRSNSMNNFEQGPSDTDGEASVKDFDTSTEAISFGFAATAILISIFLLMAIFEHLIRPRALLSQPENNANQGSMESGRHRARLHSLGKLMNSNVEDAQRCDYWVLMPGQQCPTYLAQHAPLPCPREGIQWPSHVI